MSYAIGLKRSLISKGLRPLFKKEVRRDVSLKRSLISKGLRQAVLTLVSFLESLKRSLISKGLRHSYTKIPLYVVESETLPDF